jgi:hypothetical protein
MTRSFARDPYENWLGNVRHMVSHANTTDDAELEVMRRLSYFQESVVLRMLMCGEIDVVVVPDGAGEKIVATTMWVQPGKAANPSFFQVFRLRPWRIIRAWGFRVLKVGLIDQLLGSVIDNTCQKIFLDFIPAIEKVNKQAFAAKSLNEAESWYLCIVATDPDYEGRGTRSSVPLLRST